MNVKTALAGVTAIAVFGVCAAYYLNSSTSSTPALPSEPLNVVIVLWDTVRADRMSLYGNERPTTPNIDRRAKSARVYSRAISPAMWTVPSHASLFTGLPVATHGANADWIWLDGHHTTMAEHFQSLGYQTWAWSSNPYLSPSSNLLQGFAEVSYSWQEPFASKTSAATNSKLIAEDQSVEISPKWKPSGHGQGWPEHLTAYKDAGPVIADTFDSFLQKRPEEAPPFFVYMNFLEAHHPRVPSMAARKAVADEQVIKRGLQTDSSLYRTMAYMEGKESFTSQELEDLKAVYDATLVDLDEATERVFQALERANALENTVVVLVADHGEHLGEHHLFDHRWSVFQPLIGVPLVVWGPTVTPGEVAEPVSTVNLFSQLLTWTGLPHPSSLKPTPLEGQPFAYSELLVPMKRLPFVRKLGGLDSRKWSNQYRTIVLGDDKFIAAKNRRHQLFDLKNDPGEVQNLVSQKPVIAKKMLQQVTSHRAGLTLYDPSKRAPSDSPSNALKADPTLTEQLEMLGYTDPEEKP